MTSSSHLGHESLLRRRSPESQPRNFTSSATLKSTLASLLSHSWLGVKLWLMRSTGLTSSLIQCKRIDCLDQASYKLKEHELEKKARHMSACGVSAKAAKSMNTPPPAHRCFRPRLCRLLISLSSAERPGTRSRLLGVRGQNGRRRSRLCKAWALTQRLASRETGTHGEV